MSWGLRASLLVAVDAYDGTWCTLAWLADRLRVPAQALRSVCDELAAARLMRTAVVDGEPVYGVNVTATAQRGGLG